MSSIQYPVSMYSVQQEMLVSCQVQCTISKGGEGVVVLFLVWGSMYSVLCILLYAKIEETCKEVKNPCSCQCCVGELIHGLMDG